MSAGRPAAERDAERERAVLLEALELHPATLSVGELVRAHGADPADAMESEPWRRAIRELCGHGLLRLEGETVFPTMAAIRAYELFDQ